MRIYTTKKNVPSQLEPFLYETRTVNYIWSQKNEELFQIENNKIFYVQQSRKGEKTKTLLGAFPITIDQTEYIKASEECYQIPPKCRSEILLQKVYKPSPTSLVEWIFVYEGEIFKENYFSLSADADINTPGIKADLIWGLHPHTPH
jgi:hypothetical protein